VDFVDDVVPCCVHDGGCLVWVFEDRVDEEGGDQ